MTVGPFDTRDPMVIEQENQREKEKAIANCQHKDAVNVKIGQRHNGFMAMAECEDCPCNNLVSNDFDIEDGTIVNAEWREW